MSRYDEDDFFVDALDDESLPILTPDDDTGSKPYHYDATPPGSKPFVFHNGVFDLQQEKGVKPMNPPPLILFNGGNLVVDTSIRNKLIKLDVPNLSIHPSIYIDHKDVWHEDYWYLTFVDTFDCWDRDRSTYDPDPMSDPDNYSYAMLTYSLNTELLDKTPLEERLLFKMGGTIDALVVAREFI